MLLLIKEKVLATHKGNYRNDFILIGPDKRHLLRYFNYH